MSFVRTDPGYWDLAVDLTKTLKWFYSNDLWDNYTFPQSFFDDFAKYYTFPTIDYLYICLIAVVFTVVRHLFDIYFCKPLLDYLKLDQKSNKHKFRESAWKLFTYTIFWSYCSYLLIFSGRYDYFYKPWLIWHDWVLHMDVPFDITILYFIECGFYLHSLYATVFMDVWRKDFFVMILHHIITMALITVSYGTRYHKIGILVLFVHDVTDILLEFTKLNVYLKNRNKKFYPIHEHASNIGFAVFAVAWYLFRLYWFPLKVLYTCSVTAVYQAFYRGAGLYGFFNGLLLILMILDIYWFYFIALFLYKVATGQLKEVNDTRDYDDDEDSEDEAKSKKN